MSDFMTPAPETVPLRSSIADAYETMQRLNVRHLPVVDGDRLVGIVSERDLCILKAAHGIEPSDVGVVEVMAENPYRVQPDTPIEEAAAEMARGKYGSTLVCEDGKVVGIFTTTDALRALVEFRAAESGLSL